MKEALAATLTAALLLSGPLASAQVRVLAVDGSARVEPIRGVVIEGGAARALGRGPHPGYLQDNPVFVARSGRVDLQAARNETVAFQIIVDAMGTPISSLDLTVERLVGPSELHRPEHIRIFRQWYVHVSAPSAHDRAQETSSLAETWFPVTRYATKLVTSFGPGWYPDPLIPLDGVEADRLPTLPMAIPAADNGVPGQRLQAFWIDVWVPPEAAPGIYVGDVVVETDGQLHRLPVQLDVLPVTLPEEFHAGLGSISYDFVGVTLAGLGPGPFHRFFRLLHSHRLTVDPLYLHPEWNGGRIDWRAYDALVAPLLDGSALSEEAGYAGPGRGRPVRRLVLPVDWNWPLRPDEAGHEAAFVDALRAAEEHLVAGRGGNTEWSLFINTTDEPRRTEDFALIRRYGSLLDASGVGRRHIRYRVDAGPFKSISDELTGWDVERIYDEIGDFVDIWNVCGGVPHAPAAALARRRAAHPEEEAWAYFSNSAGEPALGSLLIDGEALGGRAWGLIAWRYQLAAVVSWEVGWPDQDCMVRADCSGYGLWGDASLVYLAGRLGAPDLVLPSIRLKALRRGAEDYEYLWLLAESGRRELADAFALRLVPRALDDGLVAGMGGVWEHNPAEWDLVRRRMGRILAERELPPSPTEALRGTPVVVVPPIGLTRRAALVPAALLVVLLVWFGARPTRSR